MGRYGPMIWMAGTVVGGVVDVTVAAETTVGTLVVVVVVVVVVVTGTAGCASGA